MAHSGDTWGPKIWRNSKVPPPLKSTIGPQMQKLKFFLMPMIQKFVPNRLGVGFGPWKVTIDTKNHFSTFSPVVEKSSSKSQNHTNSKKELCCWHQRPKPRNQHTGSSVSDHRNVADAKLARFPGLRGWFRAGIWALPTKCVSKVLKNGNLESKNIGLFGHPGWAGVVGREFFGISQTHRSV